LGETVVDTRHRRAWVLGLAVSAVAVTAWSLVWQVTAGGSPPGSPTGTQPVPLDPPPVPPAVPFDANGPGGARVTAAQPATRAFGLEPYQDTTAAAAQVAAGRRAGGCGISDASLAGILLSITFTEAGPEASTTAAPSPMTLSRWDTQAILYAFANPSTPFQRAFWHPGVGLWQFDHPWSNTAAERINTKTAAELAAQVVAGRWCSWTAATGFTRFAYTVRPWHGCDDATGAGMRCQGIYDHHFRANDPADLGDDTLVAFTLQPDVTRLGGARSTSCQLVGEATPRPCLFVDPAVAQGYRGWAATSGLPTPLAAPFYVITVGTTEWRYWLSADTGYDRDIVAKATIGSNPRETLVWQSGTGMCDVGAGKGTCCDGSCFYLRNANSPGPHDIFFRDDQPATEWVVGDWDGDGVDTFGFRTGRTFALKNSLAAGPPDVTFSSGLATDEVLVGDWNGDGRDTLGLRRGRTFYLKNSLGGGLADVTFSSGLATDEVLVGDWNGDGRDTLGLRRGRTFYLRNSLGAGAADITFNSGATTDAAYAGDWNADDVDSLGLRR
jgi:hypothetical protein